MIRKSIIAMATVATITAAALVPTAASAKGGKWGHHGNWGLGSTIFVGSLAASSCMQYRWVETRRGDLVYTLVNVCRL